MPTDPQVLDGTITIGTTPDTETRYRILTAAELDDLTPTPGDLLRIAAGAVFLLSVIAGIVFGAWLAVPASWLP